MMSREASEPETSIAHLHREQMNDRMKEIQIGINLH
jgi:hypothetical protein